MRHAETRRLLLLCLSTVKRGPAHRGICSQVWAAHRLLPEQVQIDYCEQMDQLMYSLFRSWPMFSGETGYPVPGVTMGARGTYHNTTDFWSGEYGRSRRDLLNHCIEQLRNGV